MAAGARFRTMLVLAAGLAVIAVIAIISIGNRMRKEVTIEAIGDTAALGAPGGDAITVTTWNLGYGGLGAESDFKTDGGKNYLPPSRAAVDKNITGIVSELQSAAADVVILQEVARASLLTRGGDLVSAVGGALAGRDNAFSADFLVRFLPSSLSPQHGLFSSAALAGVRREIVPMPLEPQFLFGISRRLYHLHVLRFPFDGGEWTIINLHLSAFDEGANVRAEQLRAAFQFAQSEYEAGRHVVMGGDWNLEFARPGRPTTTEEEYLFWVHPFPQNALPQGWRIAIDETTPSVRTNERPYVKNENYTTIIDGFVVSPNVETVSVSTHDLDFQSSDHQPVTAKFRASAR